VSGPEHARIDVAEVGQLVLTFYPDRDQFVLGVQRPGDDAPIAADDFFLDGSAALANPTVTMLAEELRAGLEARGRSELAPYADALAAEFGRAYPGRVDG
jgi:hypothetical protein